MDLLCFHHPRPFVFAILVPFGKTITGRKNRRTLCSRISYARGSSPRANRVPQVRGPHGQVLVRGVEVSFLRPEKPQPSTSRVPNPLRVSAAADAIQGMHPNQRPPPRPPRSCHSLLPSRPPPMAYGRCDIVIFDTQSNILTEPPVETKGRS